LVVVVEGVTGVKETYLFEVARGEVILVSWDTNLVYIPAKWVKKEPGDKTVYGEGSCFEKQSGLALTCSSKCSLCEETSTPLAADSRPAGAHSRSPFVRPTNSNCDIPFMKPALKKRRGKSKSLSMSEYTPCDYI